MSALDLEMIVKCQYIQGKGCWVLSVITDNLGREVFLSSASIKVRSIFISVMMGAALVRVSSGHSQTLVLVVVLDCWR